MKIGIDIRNIGKKRTGDEVVFFNLTKNLAIIDQENEYKLFTDITDKNILEKIKKDLEIIDRKNFEIISLETKNRFSWNFWTLSMYLCKNPVDIYLTQYITPWFVPKKVKIATIIHDISFNFYPQFIKKSDLFFLKALIPLSLKRADKIIAVSRFTQDEIIKYYKIDPKKTYYMYNAVLQDLKYQEITNEKIKLVRERYNLPEKYILYIGTLQPRKNIPSLIEAYALLKMNEKEKMIPHKLVIAGGKSHNYDKGIDEILKNSSLSDEVIFPGYIDENDKGAILRGADIFVSPSLYEGFGIPILEAMNCGVPVIASDIPPYRELFGDAVLFFNPNISGELTQKIADILKNDLLRSNLVMKGEGIAKSFSWQDSAQKMLEILNK